ncbi:Agd3-related carbohydrate deacetylase [Phytohabitans rumicis]|nr:hypothetical protein [Phytohabitans rumicis]
MKTRVLAGRFAARIAAVLVMLLVCVMASAGNQAVAKKAPPDPGGLVAAGQGGVLGGGKLRPTKPTIPKALPKTNLTKIPIKDPKKPSTSTSRLSTSAAAAAAVAVAPEKVGLRQLIVALDSTDFGLATWKSTLDRMGTPYDVLLAASEPLTWERLTRADGGGRYTSILLSNNSLLMSDGAGGFVSAFDADEWNLLWQYERDYKVRQVSLYTAYGTFPEDYCLRAGTEGGVGDTPINATLSTTGRQQFDYLIPTVRVPISLSYVYYSTLAAGCTATATMNSGTNTLGVISTSTDGRERAALTFTSNQYLVQTFLLAYGLVRWATKGVFVGERRHYLEVDVDDWFNYTDHLFPDGHLETDPGFRMSGTDANSTNQQQNAMRSRYPRANQFQLNVPYNGEGIHRTAHGSCTSLLSPDPLTSYSRCLRNNFRWINHTYSHPKMNFTPYAENLTEIQQNLTVARQRGFTVPTEVLKTGEYSGLGVYHPDPNNDIDPPTDHGLMASNADLLRAAKDAGVKYLHGNMSFPSHVPSCFNCGIYHPMEPSLLLVPDWPTNIAYHVTAPAEETLFYNSFYGPNGKFPFWPRDLTYNEIVGFESDIALQHVMSGSVYAHTLHQGNLRQYASGKSLTFDWVNEIARKYSLYYQVPLQTPTWPNLAAYVANRTSHFATGSGGADVVWDRTANTLTATSPVTGGLFLTGVRATGFATYGTDSISWVTLSANTPRTFTPVPRTTA